MLFTLLAFAVALGLLITFHELGHYAVARLCGVKVLRFSVGFGRVLLQRTDRHGTEWALSAIPLGGYVKMLDDAPERATPQLASQAFNNKSVGRRFAIVLAGPVANFILAAFLYAVLGWAGGQEPAAILAAPKAGTPAAAAGIQAGDRLVQVDDEPVESWGQARWALLDRLTSGGDIALQIQESNGLTATRTLSVSPIVPTEEVDPLAEAGLRLAPARTKISEVLPNGAGAQAGLQSGDIVLRIETVQDPTPDQVVNLVKDHAQQPVRLVVMRQGAPVSVAITPQAQTADDGSRVGRIGVMLGPDFPMVQVSQGVFGGLAQGVRRTFDTAVFSLKMMGRMLVGQVSVRNISGPVTIADYAGQTARIGLAAYIAFLALISVSIGVLNLLPIPMLDGGHLMYYLLEMARGKPVPEAWMQTGQRIGLALLAGLMSLAFFNDFARLFS